MKTRAAFLLCMTPLSCGQEMPLWVSMTTQVVEGDERANTSPMVVYGTPPGEPPPEETDTGFSAPATPEGARGLFLENRSGESICHVHVHACSPGAAIEADCGRVAAGKSEITPEADVLGPVILDGQQNAELWLEDDCVSVFAVDCEQARCWESGDVDLSAGNHSVLFKGG